MLPPAKEPKPLSTLISNALVEIGRMHSTRGSLRDYIARSVKYVVDGDALLLLFISDWDSHTPFDSISIIYRMERYLEELKCYGDQFYLVFFDHNFHRYLALDPAVLLLRLALPAHFLWNTSVRAVEFVSWQTTDWKDFCDVVHPGFIITSVLSPHDDANVSITDGDILATDLVCTVLCQSIAVADVNLVEFGDLIRLNVIETWDTLGIIISTKKLRKRSGKIDILDPKEALAQMCSATQPLPLPDSPILRLVSTWDLPKAFSIGAMMNDTSRTLESLESLESASSSDSPNISTLSTITSSVPTTTTVATTAKQSCLFVMVSMALRLAYQTDMLSANQIKLFLLHYILQAALGIRDRVQHTNHSGNVFSLGKSDALQLQGDWQKWNLILVTVYSAVHVPMLQFMVSIGNLAATSSSSTVPIPDSCPSFDFVDTFDQSLYQSMIDHLQSLGEIDPLPQELKMPNPHTETPATNEEPPSSNPLPTRFRLDDSSKLGFTSAMLADLDSTWKYIVDPDVSKEKEVNDGTLKKLLESLKKNVEQSVQPQSDDSTSASSDSETEEADTKAMTDSQVEKEDDKEQLDESSNRKNDATTFWPIYVVTTPPLQRTAPSPPTTSIWPVRYRLADRVRSADGSLLPHLGAVDMIKHRAYNASNKEVIDTRHWRSGKVIRIQDQVFVDEGKHGFFHMHNYIAKLATSLQSQAQYAIRNLNDKEAKELIAKESALVAGTPPLQESELLRSYESIRSFTTTSPPARLQRFKLLIQQLDMIFRLRKAQSDSNPSLVEDLTAEMLNHLFKLLELRGIPEWNDEEMQRLLDTVVCSTFCISELRSLWAPVEAETQTSASSSPSSSTDSDSLPLEYQVVPILLPLSTVRLQLRYLGPSMQKDTEGVNDKRVSFTADPWQVKVLDGIDSGNTMLITAPTSSGKSFITFYAMEKELKASQDSVVVFVAPTVALVNQVQAEVYQRFNNRYPQKYGTSVFGSFTRDMRVSPTGCRVLVTVPACLEILLLSTPLQKEWVLKLKTVIFDEIHTISADESSVLARLLTLVPCRFIALSATIGHPDKFAEYLSTASPSGREVLLIQHDKRYNDIQKHFVEVSPQKKRKKQKKASSSSSPSPEATGELAVHLHDWHPWSFARHAHFSWGVPPASFSPKDTLTLFEAIDTYISTHKDSMPPDMLKEFEALAPEIFFLPTSSPDAGSASRYSASTSQRTRLTQMDTRSYEASLKSWFVRLIQLHSKAGMEIIERLQPATIGKKQAARFPSSNLRVHFEENIHLVVHALRMADRLPTIIFNFARAFCEEICHKLYDLYCTAAPRPVKVTTKPATTSTTTKSSLTATTNLFEHLETDEKSADQADDSSSSSSSSDQDSPVKIDPALLRLTEEGEILSKAALDSELERLRESLFKSKDGLDYGWMIDALRYGIACHHSGLRKEYKDAVERYFRIRQVKVVFATGTLAVGINMPCRSTVFMGDSIYLTPQEYRQMSGRSGRRGIDNLGHAYFWGIHMHRIAHLELSHLDAIHSYFPLSISTTLRATMLDHFLSSNGSGYDKKSRGLTATQQQETAQRLFNLYQRSLFMHQYPEQWGQVSIHTACTLEFLANNGLMSLNGTPINLAGLVAHLSWTEPSNLVIARFLVSTVARDMAKRWKTSTETVREELIHFFASLLAVVPVPIHQVRKMSSKGAKKHMDSVGCSHDAILPPLPKHLQSLIMGHRAECLSVANRCVMEFIQRCKSDAVEDDEPAAASSSSSPSASSSASLIHPPSDCAVVPRTRFFPETQLPLSHGLKFDGKLAGSTNEEITSQQQDSLIAKIQSSRLGMEMMSPFAGKLTGRDRLESVADLRSLRRGLKLTNLALLSSEDEDVLGNSQEKNAYLFDMFRFQRYEWIIEFNKFRSSELRRKSQEFMLALKTISKASEIFFTHPEDRNMVLMLKDVANTFTVRYQDIFGVRVDLDSLGVFSAESLPVTDADDPIRSDLLAPVPLRADPETQFVNQSDVFSPATSSSTNAVPTVALPTCAMCSTSFATEQDLIDHQQLGERPDFFCDECGTPFCKRILLKIHLHSTDHLIACKTQCGKKFSTPKQRKKHICSRPPIQTETSVPVTSSSTLSAAPINQPPAVAAGPTDSESSTTASLVGSTTTENPSPLTAASSDTTGLTHIQTGQQSTHEAALVDGTCSACLVVFTPAELLSHQQGKERNRCTQCGTIFCVSRLLKIHLHSTNHLIACRLQCGKKFSTLQQRKNHHQLCTHTSMQTEISALVTSFSTLPTPINLEQPSAVPAVPAIPADTTDPEHSAGASLAGSTPSQHLSPLTPASSDPTGLPHIQTGHQSTQEAAPVNRTCSTCLVVFTHEGLLSHQQGRRSEANRCTQCGMQFCIRKLLKQHLRSTNHLLSCQCGVKFDAPNLLRKHKKTCTHVESASGFPADASSPSSSTSIIPTAAEPTCAQCKSTFATERLLLVHQKMTSIFCDNCGLSYCNWDVMKKHLVVCKRRCGTKFATMKKWGKHNKICPSKSKHMDGSARATSLSSKSTPINLEVPAPPAPPASVMIVEFCSESSSGSSTSATVSLTPPSEICSSISTLSVFQEQSVEVVEVVVDCPPSPRATSPTPEMVEEVPADAVPSDWESLSAASTTDATATNGLGQTEVEKSTQKKRRGTCSECLVAFSPKGLLAHQKSRKSAKNRCRQCGMQFCVRQSLRDHQLSTNHALSKPKCQCGKKFDSPKLLGLHIKTCTHIETTSDSTEATEPNHDDDILAACSISSSPPLLPLPENITSATPGHSDIIVQIETIETMIVNDTDLESSTDEPIQPALSSVQESSVVISSSPTSNGQTTSEPETPKTRVWCPHCHRPFNGEENLIAHQVERHKFPCRLCDRRFGSLGALQDHAKALHQSSSSSASSPMVVEQSEPKSMDGISAFCSILANSSSPPLLPIPSEASSAPYEHSDLIVQIETIQSNVTDTNTNQLESTTDQSLDAMPPSDISPLTAPSTAYGSLDMLILPLSDSAPMTTGRVCTACLESFPNEAALVAHLKGGQLRINLCTECGHQFCTRRLLNIHLSMTQHQLSCGCGTKFGSPKLLEKHLTSCKQSVTEAPYVDKVEVLGTEPKHTTTPSSAESSSLPIQQRPELSSQPEAAKHHSDSTTRAESVNSTASPATERLLNLLFSANLSSSSTPSTQQASPSVTEPQVAISSSPTSSQTKSEPEAPKTRVCPHCSRVFNGAEDLKNHQVGSHSIQCKHCDRRFGSLGALQDHSKARHQSASPSTIASVASVVPMPSTASSPSASSMVPGPVRGSQVTEEANSASSSTTTAIAMPVKIHTCSVAPPCSAVFTTPEGLAAHVKAKHPTSTSTKTKTTAAIAASPAKIATAMPVKIRTCSVAPPCSAVFTTPGGLAAHVKAKHPTSTSTTTAISAPIKIHSCSIAPPCSAAFTTPEGLAAHVKAKHPTSNSTTSTTSTAVSSPSPVKIASTIAAPVKIHKCSVAPPCSAGFTTAQGLAAHVKAKHTTSNSTSTSTVTDALPTGIASAHDIPPPNQNLITCSSSHKSFEDTSSFSEHMTSATASSSSASSSASSSGIDRPQIACSICTQHFPSGGDVRIAHAGSVAATSSTIATGAQSPSPAPPPTPTPTPSSSSMLPLPFSLQGISLRMQSPNTL
jgi:replicative superfamily II helicase